MALFNPYNYAIDVAVNPEFEWSQASAPLPYSVSKYCIQVSKGWTTSDFETSSAKWVGENWTANGTTLSKVFDKTLANNTEYYWRVVTYSTEPSDNVTASVINGFTTIGVAPSIPTGLTTSSITATSAVISWNPATGSPPFTYYYQLGSNGVILQDNKNTNATSVTLTGLSPATEYSWCVLAKNSIGNSVYSNIITFTTSTAPILPGKILAIPNIHQKLNFWCWNAVCLQVLKWYRLGSINGYPINSANYENCQNEICKHAFYGSVGNYLNYLTPRPQLKGEPCSDIMQYFRQGTTVPLNFEPGDIHNPGNLSKDDVVKSIDADRPIFCAMGPTAGNQAGHILLIKGYMTVAGIKGEHVVYNDPEAPDDKELPTMKWSEFVQNTKYWWCETLRMSVSPNVFPGVNDYILVSRPACMLTLNDSATYTAIFTDSDLSGTVAKSWNWRLELFHKKGEYIVSSLQNSAASKDTLMCNWSVKVGNLPENYNWKRDEDGMIMGQVVVECLDSDPPYYLHSATVDVAFNSVPETKNTGDKK